MKRLKSMSLLRKNKKVECAWCGHVFSVKNRSSRISVKRVFPKRCPVCKHVTEFKDFVPRFMFMCHTCRNKFKASYDDLKHGCPHCHNKTGFDVNTHGVWWERVPSDRYEMDESGFLTYDEVMGDESLVDGHPLVKKLWQGDLYDDQGRINVPGFDSVGFRWRSKERK